MNAISTLNTSDSFNVKRIASTGTLTDRVSETLLQLINGDDFPAGSRLPSEMLMAERFGVSRTVIREAISRLKSEGLVESRQGSGVFVRAKNMDSPFRIDPNLMGSVDSVLQIVELRLALEGETAALAARRRTPKHIKAIYHALHTIDEDVQQGGDGADSDIAFHRSIAEAAGNPHFLSLIEFLFNFLRTATRITRQYEATKAALIQQVEEEHLAIVEAIARQDIEGARLAARKHMEGASRRLGKLRQTTFEMLAK